MITQHKQKALSFPIIAFAIFILCFQNLISKEVHVTTSFSKKEGVVIFDWDHPITYDYETDENELLLLFGDPISSKDIKDLLSISNKWIRDVQHGFDTLLITAKPNILFKVVDKENAIIIKMYLNGKQEIQKTSDNELPIGLARARLALAKGENKKAKTILDNLTKKYPNHPEIITNKIYLELQTGQWLKGLAGIKALEGIRPLSKEMQELQRDVKIDHGHLLQADFYTKNSKGNSTEAIYSLKGEGVIHKNTSSYSYLGCIIDHNNVHITSKSDPSEPMPGCNGSQQRAELYYRVEQDKGHSWKVALYGAEKLVGFGGNFQYSTTKTKTTVFFDFAHPYWGVIGSVINHGAEDCLGIHHLKSCSNKLELSAQVSVKRYTIDGYHFAALTSYISGYCTYTMRQRNPEVTLTYFLDAEYGLHNKEGVDTFGDTCNALTFSSRENHGTIANIRHIFCKVIQIEGFGGYAWNRLGSSVPLFGARIQYFPWKTWRLYLEVERSMNTFDSGDTNDSARISLSRKF